jgi:hypothetical protein
LVELSAKKRLGESSTSFRRGVFWFIRRGPFFRLFRFFAFWLRLLLPFFWLLFLLFFLFEAVVFGINDLDGVPSKGEQIRNSLQLFGDVILPRICGREKVSDRLFSKEDKDHAKGAKNLHTGI